GALGGVIGRGEWHNHTFGETARTQRPMHEGRNPMADVTPDPILQVASGFMAAKHLFVANEIRLFEQLAEGPATLDALAQRTGIPPRTLRILADAMVALGFVARQHDQYHNGPVVATFLGSRGPADLRPFLRHLNQNSYPMWTELEEVVR